MGRPGNHETSPLAVARATGVLYLAIFVLGIFSEVVVRGSIVERGDAAATVANILANETLFRVGFVTDLTVFLCDAAVAVLFYVLLRPVSRTLALVAAAFRLAQTAVLGVNVLDHFMALRLIEGEGYAGLGTEQRDALVLFALDSHRYGYLVGLAFFAVHLLVIGYLIVRSTFFPSALGVLLALAGAGYLADSLTFFLVPGYDGALSPVVLAPAVVAELGTILWLLLKGVNVPRWRRAAAPFRPDPVPSR